jgi:hypothetical protein
MDRNMNNEINTVKEKRHMKLKTMTRIFGVAAALWLCGGSLLAQDNNGGGPGGAGNGGGPGGDFDPAQFRQRMMDHIRQNLNVTNDDEWSAIQPLVQKVMEARREAGPGGGMGMGGPGGPPPGGPGGPPPDGGPGGPGRRIGFGPPASEEQKALQKALDDNAPLPQIKDALAKYRATRKDKQARLETAQANLKSVLTAKQEAQAVLMGLLP